MRYAVLTREQLSDTEHWVVAEIVDVVVPCGDGVSVGDVYVGGGFHPRAAVLTPPVPPTEAPSDTQPAWSESSGD